jgi:hypothetical protein
MTLGAANIIAILQPQLDAYADRIARGYVNIPADAGAIRDAIVLLGEMCATSPDPENDADDRSSHGAGDGL